MQEPHVGLAGLEREDYEPSIAESNVRSVYSQSPFEYLVKQFKEYEPKSNVLDLPALRASSALKLKKYKESAYYGEIVNGKRHGQGVMLYQNDRIYEGNWECDFKQGLGFEQFPNESTYFGQYVNGKPEGLGKYTWPNGEFYEGEWINGLKHGSGMWKGAKGDSYVGEWRMGKADGYGVHTWINGDRYEGDFKQCLKHGQGTEKFANGDLYKGEYQRGKPNGYGEYYWANGCYFKGTFKDGLREGQGMWKKGAGNSDKYEGEYIADKKHGYGIFSWASGNVYKGHYQDDLRTGFGEMYWSDGSYYKGMWKAGIQHGQGLISVPGQGIKKGRFQDNVLVEIYEEEAAPPKQHQLPPQIPVNPLKNLDGARRKTNSSYDHARDHSRGNMPNIRQSRDVRLPKPEAMKLVQHKTTHTAELERVSSNIGNNNINFNTKKERIPHSAYYMHKLHKRVSTAHNDGKRSLNQPVQSKGDIKDELKSFARKIIGGPSRLSSQN